MKVFVVGANGKIGKILVKKLHESPKFQVRAMVRSNDQKEALLHKGIDAVCIDLEEPVDAIAKGMEGCDAVVFTAGSGSKTGPDKTLTVDLDGAVKTIEAAEKTGVKRFVMVSALQAHHRENWNMKIKHYYVAKHYADRILVGSSLDYTIIRPGRLLDESGTGTVSIAENLERSSVPREDVADTIFEVLKNDHTIRKAFDLVSGNTPIHEALSNL